MIILEMAQPSGPHSLRRFFDRVVHRSFGDLAPGDDAAADYLSDLLTRFAGTENLYPAGALPGQRLESVAELLLEIQRAWDLDSPRFNPVRERELRRHIGDYALFRPEHGTPDLPFFRRLVTEW